MRQISENSEGIPLLSANYEYGYNTDTAAWDADIIHACVCDSSWSVGLGAGQTQLAEYFGPDCSQRESSFLSFFQQSLILHFHFFRALSFR